MSTDEFIKEVNATRLGNKNRWFMWYGVVNGHDIEIKCYNTYLQIFNIDGMRAGGGMDMTIAQFKQVLRDGVE